MKQSIHFSSRTWKIRRQEIHFRQSPLLIGVLNCTPDSFSDGGEKTSLPKLLASAQNLLTQGATILEVGGESTRPGATPVSETEEINRIHPAITALKNQFPEAILSLDTRKAAVAQAGLKAGADILNDISLLSEPKIATLAAESGAGLVLSHLRGTPETMQQNPTFADVVTEVTKELATAAQLACSLGVAKEQIVLDPGIGFGKTTDHNLSLLRHLHRLRWQDRPLFVGVSRKRFLGEICNLPNPKDRDLATAVSSAFLAQNQVELIRVHNVAASNQALQLYRHWHQEHESPSTK